MGDNEENKKKELGILGASFIKDGQRVGLGTGSTVAFAIEELGRRVKEEGLSIQCTATSFDTALLGKQFGISCVPLWDLNELDISIDGADEIDPSYHLLKGGGGSHTREKLVHSMSRRLIVIGDSSKRVEYLCQKKPVPVEILPVAMAFVHKSLEKLGAYEIKLRRGQGGDYGKYGPVITDNGNWILDTRFDMSRHDPLAMEENINAITGVLENGIFAQICPSPQDCLVS